MQKHKTDGLTLGMVEKQTKTKIKNISEKTVKYEITNFRMFELSKENMNQNPEGVRKDP